MPASGHQVTAVLIQGFQDLDIAGPQLRFEGMHAG